MRLYYILHVILAHLLNLRLISWSGGLTMNILLHSLLRWPHLIHSFFFSSFLHLSNKKCHSPSLRNVDTMKKERVWIDDLFWARSRFYTHDLKGHPNHFRQNLISARHSWNKFTKNPKATHSHMCHCAGWKFGW